MNVVEMLTVPVRRCYTCKKIKSLELFPYRDAFCTHRAYQCSVCKNAYSRIWHLRHPGVASQSSKAYVKTFEGFLSQWYHWMEDRHSLQFSRKQFYRWGLLNKKLRQVWSNYEKTNFHRDYKPTIIFKYSRIRRHYTLGNLVVSFRKHRSNAVIGKISLWGQIERKQQEILQFIRDHLKRPSMYSNDRYERSLFGCMRNYLTPKSRNYAPEFRKQLYDLCESLGITKHRNLPVGVYKCRNRFQSLLFNGGRKHLGMFNTIEEASAAIEKAKKELV
jgi:hypothetical protein